jgi:hypothetical protein
MPTFHASSFSNMTTPAFLSKWKYAVVPRTQLGTLAVSALPLIHGTPPLILAILARLGGARVNVAFFGKPPTQPEKLLSIVLGMVYFAGTVWAYRILVRPDVRRLFGRG